MEHQNKYLKQVEESGDIWFDGPYSIISQCVLCKNLEDSFCCKAFPDGIPFEVWNTPYIHEKPYPGDHGIQFEKK